MRLNIFDKAQKSIDFTNEVIKINDGILQEFQPHYRWMENESLYRDLHAILCKWPHSGTAISFEELLLNYELGKIVWLLKGRTLKEQITEDEYLTYTEILLNLLYYGSRFQLICLQNTAAQMIEYITRSLAYINYEPRFIEPDKVILTETGASLPNLSSARQPTVEERILTYKNKITKGDLNRKRDILTALANEYEPLLKKNLHESLPQFSDKLRHALNKMDIRHNNHAGKGQKAFLQTLPDKEYEQILDDIYNCLLTLHWCSEAKPGFQRICKALTELEEMEKQDK